jgi:hypothetical protein
MVEAVDGTGVGGAAGAYRLRRRHLDPAKAQARNGN